MISGLPEDTVEPNELRDLIADLDETIAQERVFVVALSFNYRELMLRVNERVQLYKSQHKLQAQVYLTRHALFELGEGSLRFLRPSTVSKGASTASAESSPRKSSLSLCKGSLSPLKGKFAARKGSLASIRNLLGFDETEWLNSKLIDLNHQIADMRKLLDDFDERIEDSSGATAFVAPATHSLLLILSWRVTRA
eukprot:6064780-Prymnesium_polylepis.2